jgi:hypothetical protein
VTAKSTAFSLLESVFIFPPILGSAEIAKGIVHKAESSMLKACLPQAWVYLSAFDFEL